jgi:hypothetical protein
MVGKEERERKGREGGSPLVHGSLATTKEQRETLFTSSGRLSHGTGYHLERRGISEGWFVANRGCSERRPYILPC